MDNTTTILTRGIPNKSKKALEKIAKKNRISVNFLILEAIDQYLKGYSSISKSIK